MDGFKVTPWAESMGKTLSLTAEQVGLKVGMLVMSLFPLMGAAVVLIIMAYFRKNRHGAR